MKDLHKLFEESMAEVRAAGITPGNIVSVKPDSRFKSRFGQCRLCSPSLTAAKYEIQIATLMLDDSIDDIKTKQVIIHEILHTCPGCLNHGAAWKARAARIHRMYPRYNITRTNSYEELGIENTAPKPYAIMCIACGSVIERTRMSNVIRFPGRYRCRCGGKLIRIR